MAFLHSPLLTDDDRPRWLPPADTYLTPGGGWLIKLALAGVDPADVEVRIDGQRLLVRGCRRDWALRGDFLQQSLEISYSRFERGFELPRSLRGGRVRARFRRGMLLVRVEPGEAP